MQEHHNNNHIGRPAITTAIGIDGKLFVINYEDWDIHQVYLEAYKAEQSGKINDWKNNATSIIHKLQLQSSDSALLLITAYNTILTALSLNNQHAIAFNNRHSINVLATLTNAHTKLLNTNPANLNQRYKIDLYSRYSKILESEFITVDTLLKAWMQKVSNVRNMGGAAATLLKTYEQLQDEKYPQHHHLKNNNISQSQAIQAAQPPAALPAATVTKDNPADAKLLKTPHKKPDGIVIPPDKGDHSINNNNNNIRRIPSPTWAGKEDAKGQNRDNTVSKK